MVVIIFNTNIILVINKLNLCCTVHKFQIHIDSELNL